MIEIIQLNISGEDKPGLTTALTSILAQYDATILDIGQENIHKSLTLGILFKTTPEQSGFIMKDLLFKASELGVQIRFTPIEREAYDAWVARQGKNRYIVTLLGRSVSAGQIADVTEVIFRHGLNIDAIRRLTGRPPLEEVDANASKACIEISVRGSLDHGGSMIMLAKGNRAQCVTDACKKHGGFYLGSIGGPAAILAQNNIKSIECVEYPELGMEAIWKIKVEDFPAFILVDDKGNDFFKQLGL